MENPVTRARVILREELIEIVKLIKKVKKLNYDTVKLIAQRTNDSDLYYDEDYKIVCYSDEDGYVSEISDDVKHDIEALSKIVELCGVPAVINKFKQMKTLTEKSIVVDNVECILIRPQMIGSYIVTVESEETVFKNFYEVWKRVVGYKEFLREVLKHNKKIKNEISKLSYQTHGQ